jgi:hypothetical protein
VYKIENFFIRIHKTHFTLSIFDKPTLLLETTQYFIITHIQPPINKKMSGFFDYDIKCCRKYFKWRKDRESKKWELDVHRDLVKREDATKKDRAHFQKCIEKEEKELAAIEEKISEYESRSSDVFAQKYIDELPVTRKRIILSDELDKFKLSKVPDLSRFENLETLNLSGNEYMTSGFDRLPVSLRKLDCYKTKNNPDASWVTRLVNLEELTLRRNDEVGELPDLSGLTKLKVKARLKIILNQFILK